MWPGPEESTMLARQCRSRRGRRRRRRAILFPPRCVSRAVPVNDSSLLHELVACAASRTPAAIALTDGERQVSYESLLEAIRRFAAGLVQAGIGRGDRVGIYLEKRIETVVASFGAAAAGAVFVPINPVLKAEQVGFILADCDVRLLVTSPERLVTLTEMVDRCGSLARVVATGAEPGVPAGLPPRLASSSWAAFVDTPPGAHHRVIDTDMVAILYTSGSTGKPKGVVLSHRNMVLGAKSVASYLGNHGGDTLLAALPLSFDAGFSQLTTAFHSGARVVLLNHVLPRDVLKTMEREKVTGLTAVPPLYIQLAALKWPEAIAANLRYFANTGGRMPLETLTLLRRHLPHSRPFLMYGLTEAFRSTYLPPEEVDRRPDSIGKAIPNAEILVLREDGTPCDADEPGELVHRGGLVGLGYWNDAAKTAERYKPLPAGGPWREGGLQLPEFAVFSGDTVRRDAEGFLYFIGRRDEMIKTSGYRVSPAEVEEILYATRHVGECVAFGVEHAVLGQAIQVIATAPSGRESVDLAALQAQCKARMPAYMVPAGFDIRSGPLPRNPNGKIDRKRLSTEWIARSADAASPT
jgi:acyl-CoA ligase (AMP-forming) (exosortase A-associated)